MRPALKLLDLLCAWAYVPQDPRRFALARIGLGLTMIAAYLHISPHLEFIYGASGLAPAKLVLTRHVELVSCPTCGQSRTVARSALARWAAAGCGSWTWA